MRMLNVIERWSETKNNKSRGHKGTAEIAEQFQGCGKDEGPWGMVRGENAVRLWSQ